MKKITKKTKFGELLSEYPEAEEVLLEKGMFCFGCPHARFETIEEGATAHGIEPEELIEYIKKKIK